MEQNQFLNTKDIQRRNELLEMDSTALASRRDDAARRAAVGGAAGGPASSRNASTPGEKIDALFAREDPRNVGKMLELSVILAAGGAVLSHKDGFEYRASLEHLKKYYEPKKSVAGKYLFSKKGSPAAV